MAGSGRTTLSPRAREVGTGPAATPAAPARDLRAHLPGVEPQRQLDDWGRSERVEALLDRTLVEPLYRYWLRVEVEGVEHVPRAGGALLAANGPAAPSLEAAMIARALREQHPLARRLHVALEPRLRGLPGAALLTSKLGGVAAHPANLHRLLHDEGHLVLAFPERRQRGARPYRDRYRLRGFGRPGFAAAALRARAPIVPVCVVGAEEARPVFGRLPGAGPLARHGVPLALPALLPAKLRLRFLDPVRPAEDGGGAPEASAQAIADQVALRVQQGLWDMLGRRRSTWLG